MVTRKWPKSQVVLETAGQSSHGSKEEYLLLLNSTAEGIYGLDLRGQCTFCNPACLRLLGYQSPGDLIGKNIHAFVHHARADRTLHSEENCRICAVAREGQAGQASEVVLWRGDGTSFLATHWSRPMYKAGAFAGTVVSFIDASERSPKEQALREFERKYRELVENATYGFYRSDPKGKFLDANQALVTMLGYSSKAELMKRNLTYRKIKNHFWRVQ